MKVLVKSDRIPIVLMVIGAAFVIVSSLSDHVADEEFKIFLFPVGFSIMVLGFLLWAIPTYQKYLRKKPPIKFAINAVNRWSLNEGVMADFWPAAVIRIAKARNR